MKRQANEQKEGYPFRLDSLWNSSRGKDLEVVWSWWPVLISGFSVAIMNFRSHHYTRCAAYQPTHSPTRLRT